MFWTIGRLRPPPFTLNATLKREEGGDPAPVPSGDSRARSILCLVHQAILGDPRHHGAQLLAHLFDVVLG